MTNNFYNYYKFFEHKFIGYFKAYKSISTLNQMTKSGIFDIHNAAINLPWEAFRAKMNEIFMQNAYYGISYNIKEYSNYCKTKPFFFNIEHGLYLGDNYISKWDLPKTTNSLITFSQYRKSVLEKFSVKHKIHLIGPYIHYAKPFLNKSTFNNIKFNMGKTLLVFPSHSTHDYIKKSKSDLRLLHFIEDFSREFNTVMVCLYWKDVELGFEKMYEEKGYTCVCAGHIFDFNFLNRLKTIINLADYTISNDIGTHIGYCINENKPHYIVKSNIQFEKDEGLAYNKNYKCLITAFTKSINNITTEQLDISNYYWGLEYKMNKNQVIELIRNIDNHYNNIKNQRYDGMF